MEIGDLYVLYIYVLYIYVCVVHARHFSSTGPVVRNVGGTTGNETKNVLKWNRVLWLLFSIKSSLLR